MAVPYRDILDMFDAQKATNNYQSLPEFAQSLNDLTGTNLYDAGLKDSWVKRASVGLDRAIESTGAPDALGSFFGDIGDSFGYRAAGESAGRALPRGVVNFLPLMAATALTGGAAAGAGLLGAGATAASAALSGAGAYTETGSPTAGFLTAAALPLAGVAAGIGGQLALKAIGAPLLEGSAKTVAQIAAEGLLPRFTPEIQEGLAQTGKRVAETLAQKAASYLGGQAAALSTFEAANEASSVITGGGLYNPLEPEKLFGMLIGQLPFAALDIPRVAKSTPSVDSMKRFLTTEVKNKQAETALTELKVKTEAGQVVDPVTLVKGIKEALDKSSKAKTDAKAGKLSPEELQKQLDELTSVVEKGSQATKGTEQAGLGFGQWIQQQGEEYKKLQVVSKGQEKVVETNKVAEELKQSLPPSDLTTAITQVDDLVKNAVQVGASDVTVDKLKANLENVQDTSASDTEAAQKSVQVEKNKVSRAASLKAATLASSVAKETKFAKRLQELGNREELSRTSDPNAELYKKDLEQINKFLTTNQEQVGEGKSAGTSLSRVVTNTYFNWEDAGRPGGYEELQKRMGKAKQNQRREATVSRPTLKVDGSIDNDANKTAMRFTSIEEALKYSDEKRLTLLPQPRKKGKWYVLEQTQKAAKVTSLQNAQGGEKAVVSEAVAHVISPTSEANYFEQLDSGTEDGTNEEVNHDQASPVIGVLNEEDNSVPLVKETIWNDLVSAVNNLDDETIHAEFMNEMGGDVEEHTRDIQNVRNRITAILELQKQFGNKSVNDPSKLEALNKLMPSSSKFDDINAVREFNKDEGTQALLLQATKSLIRAGTVLPSDVSPHGEGWTKLEGTGADYERRGFAEDLTDFQKATAEKYRLNGNKYTGYEPLSAVAENDSGLLGTIARSLITSFTDKLIRVNIVNERQQDGKVISSADYSYKGNKILYGKSLLPQVSFDPNSLYHLHYAIVHETLHALTHDLLQNNSLEKANLDTLRQRAIEALPKDIRREFDQAKAENRYEQYAADRSIRVFRLPNDQAKWQGVLYGLLNVDEFISQAFSSNQMQKFLREQGSTRKQNLYQTFKNFVKRLANLGDVDDSLFNDVISATDRLLNPHLRKPFETDNLLSGILGQFGLTSKEVTERTQTAKGVLDLLTYVGPKIPDPKWYRDTLAGTLVEGFTTAHEQGKLGVEDTQALNRAQAHFDNLADKPREFLIDWVGDKYTKTLGDLLQVMGRKLGDKDQRRVFLNRLSLVDEPIIKALAAFRRYATVTISSINQLMDGAEKGLVDTITESPGGEHLQELFNGTQELLQTEKKLNKVSNQLASLEGVDPVGFRSAQSQASEGNRAYENAPDSLMGFRKSGFNKGFDETNYKFEQPVKVTFDDGTSMVDSIKGLNQSHALERARRNWEGAKIEVASQDELNQALREDRGQPLPANFENENIMSIAEELGIIKPSLWTKTFEPIAQIAEKYPIIRDSLYKVFKHQGDVREAVRTALLAFAGEFGPNGEVTFSKKRIQEAYEVANSPVMNKAVSDVRRLMNDKKMGFDPTDAVFRDTLDRLGKEQRPQVIAFVNQMTKSMKVMQDIIVDKQSELGTITLAQIIQSRNPEFRSSQSSSLAKSINEGLRMLDDPTQIEQGRLLLQNVQTKMTPEVAKEVFEFAVGDKQRVKELGQFYAGRQWFSTEQRFRRFLVRMTDSEGGTYTPDFNTEGEANRAIRRLQGEGYKYQDLIDRKGNDDHPSFDSDAMIDKVAEINKTRLGQVQVILQQTNPEAFESIKNYLNIDQDLKRAKVASQLINKGSQLKRQGGREELDMIYNHVSYVNKVINSQTAKVTRAGLELALLDPELKDQTPLKQLAKSALNNYMVPDTAVGRGLTRANFLYFMGMNPSTALMELGQSALSLIPTMVREGLDVQKAYGSVLHSAKLITKWAVTNKWDNPEHQQVLDRAGARGDIGLGALNDAMDDNAHASIGLSQMATNQQMSPVSSLLKKPLALYEKLATTFYSKFPAFNARMALLTAFDHFRRQGMEFEEAFANAERINNIANFAGGRAARSVGLYGLEGEVGRTASMAVGSLQSYTLGMISMMGRFISQGFGDLSKGLTPGDRRSARKAAIVMFGTQLAAAGALGLPGIGAGIAVLEQIFPDLELNKLIRENLAKIGGDDQALGSFISDTALRGLPNQLGGVDVGSRLSLGNNVLGLSSYDGFDVSNILGPSLNLFKNMAVGVTQATQGNLGGAVQSMVPPAYKKLIALGQGEGAIRDGQGKLLLEPSMGEKFALMLGFQPKALSDLKDAKRIESRSQDIEKRKTIQFNSQVADALQSGDKSQLRNLLQGKLKEDETFDPRSAVRAAASLVEQRTQPLDLSRTSTSSTANTLLSTYQGGTTHAPTELQRLQLRKQIESSSGIPGIGRISAQDIHEAQMIDALMAKGLTRDEALVKVNGQGKPQVTLPSF